MSEKELADAFKQFAYDDTKAAMALITGLFVGLITNYMEAQGLDASKKIDIENPNGERRITIHAEGE